MALTKITSRILDSSGVTTVGTISTGVWQGTAINQTYLVGQSGTNTGDETLARINALDITELGTISSGVWNGTVIASAYLDADTAHLSTTQTFTGAKTFSSNTTFSGDIALTGDSKIQATADLGIGARNGTTNAGAVYIGGANDNPFISPTAFFGTDGKVGIGTTSPGASKLTVSDGVAGYSTANILLQVKRNATNSNDDTSKASILLGNNSNAFQIAYGGTTDRLRFINGGGTEQLTLLNGGNVGVGTDSPSAKLTIDLGDSSSAPTTFTTSNSYLQLGTTSYNTAGAVYSIGFGYTGGSTNSPAYIGLKQTGTGNATKGDLVFLTRDSTNDIAPTERLRISSNGKVGIGTTTMHQDLNLISSSTSQSLINIGTSNSSRFLNVGVSGSAGYIMMENAAALNIGTGGVTRLFISSGGEYSFGTPSSVTYSHGSNDGFHLRTGLELGFGNGNNNRPDFGINATGSGGGASLNIYCGEGSDDVDIQIAPNAVMQFNSGGIKFGSSGSTLDAYEEGTWNPTPGRTSGTQPTVSSYGYRDGTYTKVGRLVVVMWDFTAAVTNQGSTAAISIKGLPFQVGTAAASGGAMAGYSVANFRSSSLYASSTAQRILGGFAQQGDYYIYVESQKMGTDGFASGGSVNNYLLNTSWARSTGFCIYFTN